MKGGKYDPCQGMRKSLHSQCLQELVGDWALRFFAFQYGGQIDVFLSNRLFPLFRICILISVFLSTLVAKR